MCFLACVDVRTYVHHTYIHTTYTFGSIIYSTPEIIPVGRRCFVGVGCHVIIRHGLFTVNSRRRRRRRRSRGIVHRPCGHPGKFREKHHTTYNIAKIESGMKVYFAHRQLQYPQKFDEESSKSNVQLGFVVIKKKTKQSLRSCVAEATKPLLGCVDRCVDLQATNIHHHHAKSNQFREPLSITNDLSRHAHLSRQARPTHTAYNIHTTYIHIHTRTWM